MAGAGYKLFNTGDVLTAAQVNTYLMQQTVMVFASATARTTALSGVLAEGMVSYLQDTNALEVYDGSAWVASAAGDITNVSVTSPITGGGASGSVTIGWDVAVGNQANESAQTASYTLVAGDAGKLVTMNNASANNLTVPPNSSVAFATGTRIDIIQYGTGQTTVVAGSGVTIRSSGSKLKLTGQYSGASLWKKGTDEWILIGDIAS